MRQRHFSNLRLLWRLGLIICLSLAGSGRAEPPGSVATDQYSDPLPAGARARLGTSRWRPSLSCGLGLGSLRFSQDGKRVLAVGDFGLALWDVATGKTIEWSGVQPRIIAAAFGQNDKTIWTAQAPVSVWFAPGTIGQRQLIEQRGIDTGRLRHRVALIRSDLFGTLAMFSPNGAMLLVAPNEKKVELWDTASGKQRLKLSQGWDRNSPIIWTNSGDKVAFLGRDRRLHVFDTSRGNEYPTTGPKPDWRYRDSMQRWALAPDGKTLALTTADGITLWDVTTGQRKRHLRAGWGSLVFSADGKSLALGGSKAIRLWQLKPFREVGRFKPHHDFIQALAISPDDRQIACLQTNMLGLWDVASGRQINRGPGHSKTVHALAFSPDGKVLASGGEDGAAIVWDLATGRPRYRLEGHVPTPVAFAFSPDGKVLAAGDGTPSFANNHEEAQIRLWDRKHGQLVRQFPGHRNTVSSLAFSPDGRLLASAGGDAHARLWDPATGRQLYQVPGPEGWWLVAFSPDGKHLLTADSTGSLMVRQPDMGAVIRALRPSPGRYTNLELAGMVMLRDNRTIISEELNSQKNTLTLQWWDSRDGHARRSLTLPNVENDVRRPAISPDGRLAATALDYDAIQLWDLTTGRPLATLHGHTASLTVLAFSPDCQTLASGGTDTSVLLWDVPRIRLLTAWRDLSGGPAQATAATRVLRANPDAAIPLIRDFLNKLARQELGYAGLIHDLDDRHFQVREKATRRLLAALPGADLALRLALEGNPSAEMRRRIEYLRAAEESRIQQLVDKLDTDDGDDAKKQLEPLGRATEPALQALLRRDPIMAGFPTNTPSLTQEGRMRAVRLVTKLQEPDISWHEPSASGIRRALTLLAAFNTPAARQALEQLAAGSAETFVGRAARKALARTPAGNSSR